MLKLSESGKLSNLSSAAAFGRLCVETVVVNLKHFGCLHAAAFGRLCVETIPATPKDWTTESSRLRAAVC